MSHVMITPPAVPAAPFDLGRDSVLWRYFGDWRLGLVLGRGLVLQTCHPTIGAGVAEHSIYREDPWARLQRSLFPIVDTIYAADAEAVGARIREGHRRIRGTDHRGRAYHAWEPEAYWFVLSSAVDCMITMAELYVGEPLGARDRERVVAETREVGRRMGLRDRDMPAGWRAFRAAYDEILHDRLEAHPTAHEVLDVIAEPPAPGWLPLRRLSGPAFSTPTGHLMTLATVGTLPPVVRERLGLPWSARQEHELRAVARAIRTSFRAVPEPLRYMPAARDAFRRTRPRAAA
jgi:uncharacterized protein (DUF2236 family)